MITLHNKQRSVKIDRDYLIRDVTAMLRKLGYDEYDLGIVLVNDATMQQYMSDFLGSKIFIIC